ncbi:PREDICTED: late cornified envelope protein 6A [Condylura cristata]|uniref:late cornified envelope protein 6A n=1 Tax=Condylura cristata TaxID=143302 RepID=UPI0003347F3D|nr:PREDICTED: late cornified envelope protein 6A [Condylura cristata]
MSQQKRSWEPARGPVCSHPQGSAPSLAPCSAPCAPCSGGCGSGSQKLQNQNRPGTRRAHRKPRCLSGGTTYHIKEEEC